jgi:uncharacterized protein (TIGR00661 family)
MRVLVAVLDWGLGHASRCVPLVQMLLERGYELQLASNDPALTLLQTEFPGLAIHALPSYNVRYPGKNLWLNMAWQLPRIALRIWQEQKFLVQLQKHQQFDLVIADHRYGCFLRSIPSIFLCHQLHLPLPKWPVGWLVQAVHMAMLRNFQAIWVPDYPGQPNLAGKLAHPPMPNLPTYYIGPLTRMRAGQDTKVFDAGFILSGPEPQRSLFEQIIRKEVQKFPDLRFLLVQGLVGGSPSSAPEGNLVISPFLTTFDLQEKINQCMGIICRSGYSSLMDLAVLQKKTYLVPTPAQPEQAYLAKKLGDEAGIGWCEQEDFDLRTALQCLKNIPALHYPTTELLEKALAECTKTGTYEDA